MKFAVTSMPSRLTRAEPWQRERHAVDTGRQADNRYWPLPSVTTVRTFSISAGLEASTVAPGSTAPERVFDNAGDGSERLSETRRGQNDQNQDDHDCGRDRSHTFSLRSFRNSMRGTARHLSRTLLTGPKNSPRAGAFTHTQQMCNCGDTIQPMLGGCQRTVRPSHREKRMESNDLNREGAEAAETISTGGRGDAETPLPGGRGDDSTQRPPRLQLSLDSLCVLRGLAAFHHVLCANPRPRRRFNAETAEIAESIKMPAGCFARLCVRSVLCAPEAAETIQRRDRRDGARPAYQAIRARAANRYRPTDRVCSFTPAPGA